MDCIGCIFFISEFLSLNWRRRELRRASFFFHRESCLGAILTRNMTVLVD